MIMKTFFTLVFLISSFFAFSQEHAVAGEVRSKQTHRYLKKVTVENRNNGETTWTGTQGEFIVKAHVGDSLWFYKEGYATVKLKLSSLDKLLVEMEECEECETTSQIVDIIAFEEMEEEFFISFDYSTGARIPPPPSSYSYSNFSVTEPSNESYASISENGFRRVFSSPLSTFSIDVDRASYSNIRRMIDQGTPVPKDAVKVEEMINYFDYEYPQPTDEHPFAVHTEVGNCPWNKDHRLVKIGIQGKEIPQEDLPASNLVFLIDVSGSMDTPNKLPLLKSAFKLLVKQLRPHDRVSIVVYAGAAGLVLPPTKGSDKVTIMEALDNLRAGGSTAGGAGIELAYKIAEENMLKKGNNRVILATDGDFNVGRSSDSAMEQLITQKRRSGIFLTCLGVGMGNYKDSKLETLADKGNGNHAYIDTMQEAQKILGSEFGGTLFTIAKDVKIQVEFNPQKVQAYRLVGYENRLLNAEDFRDDTKDAGELGSGHRVTALYELIPVGVKSKFLKAVDTLKYSKSVTSSNAELLTVKFRYKKPKGKTSVEIIRPVDSYISEHPSEDFQFTSAVAMFGMYLRESEYLNGISKEGIIELAQKGKGVDRDGYRGEFIRLVKTHRKQRIEN